MPSYKKKNLTPQQIMESRADWLDFMQSVKTKYAKHGFTHNELVKIASSLYTAEVCKKNLKKTKKNETYIVNKYIKEKKEKGTIL
jgi:hypothetical protein